MAFVYVYILQSEIEPEHFYTGLTGELRERLKRHNEGRIRYTSKWKPWRLKTYNAMSDRKCAAAFEKYLKSHSGQAFATKHFQASVAAE